MSGQRSSSIAPEQLVITGSSGFIGGHLCRRAHADGMRPLGVDICVPGADVTHRHVTADLRDLSAIPRGPVRATVHLAAFAEAVVPFDETVTLWQTNVIAAANTLRALDPATCVVASSCAVYGNITLQRAQPTLDCIGPVGQYGMTKAALELVCRDWAAATRRPALAFRFGNVIGPSCRGLIPYLVEHAVRNGGRAEPARLRGNGRIVRDYVPVSHVVEILHAAATREWPAGLHIFNIGTGRGRTNGVVAKYVAALLGARGYPLTLDFSGPIGGGEARHAVVDPGRTSKVFGIEPPGEQEVLATIEAAVDHHLRAARARAAAVAAPV